MVPTNQSIGGWKNPAKIGVGMILPHGPIEHVHHQAGTGLGFYVPLWQSHHPTQILGDISSPTDVCEAGDVISKSPIVGTSIPSPVIWLIYGYYKVNIWLMGIYIYIIYILYIYIIYIYIWGFPYNKKGTSIPSHIYIYIPSNDIFTL